MTPFWKNYTSPFKLWKLGIMGMNVRNCRYISPYNPRSLYPLVDDKLKTKEIALKAGVTVPNLIGCIRHQFEVSELIKMIGERTEFCIKPSRGSGGKGILVIVGRNGDKFVKPSGQEITLEDVERHVSNILAGLFSLGGKLDKALLEELIHFDNAYEGYSYEGVPDARIIVFKGYPVMAMMRLSTACSDGKANLHQGAVGVGLCLRTGKAVRAVQFNKPVTTHPDTGKLLSELKVPHWEKTLKLAASCYEMSGLGYIGTDIVLDRDKGPLLLELNARPGLAIQIANAAGLLHRLRNIEKLLKGDPRMTVEERIEYSQKHFGVYDM